MEAAMSACETCPNAIPRDAASGGARSRLSLSKPATTVVAAIAAMTFAASGAAPTPLYHQYQESFGLTPAIVTVIFAAYVLSLLSALLTMGSLSDHIGRRPVILAALATNIVAMIMFMTAGSAFALIAARAVQGVANGAAIAALGAAILDTDSSRGPVINSVTVFIGLTLGSLGSGLLVSFAPDPTHLVYVVLLALSALELAVLWRMPETTRPRGGALASLRPHVSVPAQAQGLLMRLTPVTIASWALGGFYFSLMPSLVRTATGATLPVVGGLVVAALTFSATISVLLMRGVAADRMLRNGIPALALGVAITLAGVQAQWVTLMLAGTLVAGIGFGAAFAGTVRAVLPLAKPGERAGLLAAFYVEGYLSFSLPAMLAGFLAPTVGLTTAADIYGAMVIVLAVVSLLAMRRGAEATA
jgi:hypothetical protein